MRKCLIALLFSGSIIFSGCVAPKRFSATSLPSFSEVKLAYRPFHPFAEKEAPHPIWFFIKPREHLHTWLTVNQAGQENKILVCGFLVKAYLIGSDIVILSRYAMSDANDERYVLQANQKRVTTDSTNGVPELIAEKTDGDGIVIFLQFASGKRNQVYPLVKK